MQGLEIGGLGQGEHGPLIRGDGHLQPLRGVDAGPALTHAHAFGVLERADHNVEDELGVLGEEDAGALAEGHFEGIERGVLAAGQGGIGPVVALGFVLVDDGY